MREKYRLQRNYQKKIQILQFPIFSDYLISSNYAKCVKNYVQ